MRECGVLVEEDGTVTKIPTSRLTLEPDGDFSSTFVRAEGDRRVRYPHAGTVLHEKNGRRVRYHVYSNKFGAVSYVQRRLGE